jgi:DNA repair photolyase
MQYIPAKTIIIKTKKPGAWFGAEYNMNIYRGCAHGCIYCDSRSDCYRNPDFDTVKAKEDALRIIRDELSRRAGRGVIATGAMSDPYNPFEREMRLTGSALELFNAFRAGVAIDTKGTLVTRDTDVLRDIMSHSPVIVKMTITTCDDDLARKIEPGAASPTERFGALRELSDAGVFCGVLMMPILPFISDTEENISGILRQAKEAGARFVYPSFGMTLRSGNREYYYQKLDEHFPQIKQKYIGAYGDRYICISRKAKKLWHVFSGLCEEYGLLYKMKDITRAYKNGYISEQLSFL